MTQITQTPSLDTAVAIAREVRAAGGRALIVGGWVRDRRRGGGGRGAPRPPAAARARRRDFTINAIAWDPLTSQYEDPWKGRADIDARVLRAVDPRTFPEGSLRVLRAVQVA